MNDHYLSRYGLEFNPFLKNSKEILVTTKEHSEVVTRLNVLANSHGFGLITGAPGRGKTTTVRNWANGLNPSLFKVVYSGLSTLTVMEFYRKLAEDLGVHPAYRKSDNFRIIQDEITRFAVEKKKTPVIIIDEANSISSAVLHDLKILFNFEMDSRDRAILLLVGLPVLNSTLRLSVHESLRQRITMNYNLEGLSKEEARSYISQKLSAAGASFPVFDDPAIEAIINAADGTPRLINKLCSAAFLIGDNIAASSINADIVFQSINDCELG